MNKGTKENKVFVYFAATEEYPIGEADIKVFSTREDAVAHLKNDVEEYFGEPFDALDEYFSEEGYEEYSVAEDFVTATQDVEESFAVNWEIRELEIQ